MDPDAVLENLGFKILKTIGEGGFGTVKLAEAKRHHKNVAIKIMDPAKNEDPEFAAICLPREISILEKVRHPNIIQVHEMHSIPTGQVCVVMEAAAMDLGEKIEAQNNSVAVDQAKTWFRQILNAMIYLHDQDIAHRDLKCENILLTDENQVRLTDFGLGCFTKGFPDLCGDYCGSLYYMAPEVLRGEYYDAKKADVWSLGVILYILVTGKDPYSGDDSETFRKAHKEPFKFPEGITIEKSCRSIISYMLQVDPLKRPSMREVAQHPWVRPRRDSYRRAVHGPQSESGTTIYENNHTQRNDKEYICRGCFPLGQAVRGAAKALLSPFLKASRSLSKRIRKFFKRRPVVCDGQKPRGKTLK